MSRNYIKTWSQKQNLATLTWALVLNKYKLLYVPTPKVANTKIRTLLILLNRGYYDQELETFINSTLAAFYSWEFGIPDNHRLDLKTLHNLFYSSDYFKFAFVRNPYERLASMYAYRIRAPQSFLSPSQATKDDYILMQQQAIYFAQTIKAEIDWCSSGFMKRFFSQLDSLFVNQIGNSIMFRDEYMKKFPLQKSEKYDYRQIEQRIYESFLNSHMNKRYPDNFYLRFSERIKRLLGFPDIEMIDLEKNPISFEEFINFVCDQDPKCMDIHWQPQTLLIHWNSIQYDFIGHIESFAKDMQYVLDCVEAPKYIYDLVKEKRNSSQKKGKEIIWTDELAGKVYRKYQDDFEAFKYSKSSYQNN